MPKSFDEWARGASSSGTREKGSQPRSFDQWTADKAAEGPKSSTGYMVVQGDPFQDYLKSLEENVRKTTDAYRNAGRSSFAEPDVDPMYAGYATDPLTAAQMGTNGSSAAEKPDRKQLYREMKEAKDELAAAQQMAAYAKKLRQYGGSSEDMFADYEKRISELTGQYRANPGDYKNIRKQIKDLEKERDSLKSYDNSIKQSSDNAALIDAWAKGHKGTQESMREAEAAYKKADDEVIRLQNALTDAGASEGDYSGWATDEMTAAAIAEKHTAPAGSPSSAELKQQLSEAVRAREQARLIMNYARAHQGDDLKNAEDYDLKADEGEILFEEYKKEPVVYDESALEATAYGGTAESNSNPYQMDTSYREPDSRWTEEERKNYFYLFASNRQDAFDYAAFVNQRYNAGEAEERDLSWEEFATRNPVTGAIASVGSVPGGLLGGAADYMRMSAEYMGRGGIYETQYDGLSRWADVTRGSIGEKLNEQGTVPNDVPVLGGKGFGDLYQLMMSMADSAVAVAAGGGAANAIFFGSAASSTTRQALERGLPAGQALATGFAAGAAEVIGETLSVENLLKASDVADYLRKGLLKEILQQGAVEASEEVMTTIMNTLADAVINGNEAEFQQNVYVNMQNGMSYDEAVRKARIDWLNNLGADALGGFLSGSMMSGGRAAAKSGIAAATTYKGDTQELLDIASTADEGSDARKLAEDYQKSYNDKGKLSNLQAARLRAYAVADINAEDRQTLLTTVENRLKEQSTKKLYSDEYKRMAEKIVDQALSGEDSNGFQTALENNVYRELQMQLEGKTAPTGNWARVEGLKQTQARQISERRMKNVELKKSGQRVEVKQAVMQDGKLALTVEQNGKETPVSLDDLNLDPYQQRALNTLTRILGQDAASAYNGMTFSEWGGSTYDVLQYANAFATIRDLFGATGATEEAAMATPLRKGLTDAQVLRAYGIGKERGKARREARPKSLRGSGNISMEGFSVKGADGKDVKVPGLKNAEKVKKSKKYRALEAIAKALGIDVVLFDSGNGEVSDLNGAYDNGVIYLDWSALASDKKYTSSWAMFRAMSHELTHFIQQNAQEEYAELKDFVIGYLADAMGQDFNDLVTSKMTREIQIRQLSREAAEDEVVADACETMLANSEYVQKLADEKPGLFETIRGWLRSIFMRVEASDEGARMMQPVTKELQAIWDRALQKAVESRVSEETLADLPTIEEMQQAAPETVEQVFTPEMRDTILQMEKHGQPMTIGQQKLADLFRQAQTVKNAGNQRQLMLPAHQEQQATRQERPKMDRGTLRRFNKAVEEEMEAASWDGDELTRDQAEKIILDYAATHEGYFSMTDQARETGAYRTQKQYAESLRESMDAESGVADVVNAEGTTVATTNSETGTAQLSIRTYDEGGRQALQDFLSKRVKDGALTQKEAREMREQIEQLYRICKEYDNGTYAPFSAWSNAEVVTYDGRPVFSVVKANGEYKLNLDFSLVCKKRRTLDAVFNEMISQGIMDDFDMVQESIAKINDIIRENGFETACGLCFVDSKRYRQGMIADAFVMMYNTQVFSLVKKGAGQKMDYFNYGGDQTIQNSGAGIDTLADDELNWTMIDKILRTEKKNTVKYKIADYLKNNPSARRLVKRGDFMSTAGFDALKAQNPALLSLYNSKKGAGGPKAAQSDVQYLNEIINQNMFNEKAAYEVGGVRIQSFSDYVGRLVFDYVQMVGDLAAKKLPAHSYTKEFMFAEQFGLTGIKINMSLVPDVVKGGVAAGLDAEGNYAWKDGQSFGSTVYDNRGKRMTAAEGFELAKRIQNADGYSRNCGTIAVGVSDEHINKMLDDPEIRMIIPYHKSSLNHIVAAMMNIDQYTDYTLKQNTRQRKNGKLVNIPKGAEFNFNEALQRLGDAKAAANEYLSWCRENGYTPKFDQFAWNENYYKLLEDFSCYDKDGVTNTPMGPVQMNFPTESDAFGSMSELIRQGLDEDAMLQARQEKAVPEIVKQIQAVLPEFEGTVRERNAKKKASKKAASTGGVQFSTRKEALAIKDVDWMDDFSSVKEQLAKHRDEISSMDPVAEITYEGEDRADLERLILEQLPRLGGPRMKKNGLSLEFDKEGAHAIVLHARSEELRAAALASPFVIKHGKLIAGQRNHENTNMTTLTFAAPVLINGERVNAGAVVQFTSNGRPRAVNVETESGGVFKIKRTAQGLRSRTGKKSQVLQLLTRAVTSEDRITQDSEESNTEFQASARDTDQTAELQFSYGGRHAETMDSMALRRAEAMEEAGDDAETIRKETGWFRGMDKQWRFEIDNKEMKISKAYNAETGTYALGDLISHDKLFEAYPRLRNVSVEVEDLGPGTKGYYQRYWDRIAVDKAVFADKKTLKSVLSHEIQHAIQAIEGFTPGASSEYWRKNGRAYRDYLQNRVYSLEQQVSKAAKELDPILGEIGYYGYDFELESREFVGDITPEEHEKMLLDYLRSKSQKGYELQMLYEQLRDELQRTRKSLYSDPSAYSLYERTAGEIEARDVQKRLNYDEEKRRGRRPDIDRMDAVFAQYSVRSDAKTDREMLEDAKAEGRSVEQQKALSAYKQLAERYHAREREVSNELVKLDKLVEDGTDREAVNKQRARVTEAERKLAKALNALTEAQNGTEIREILRAEREIQRRRTRAQTRETLNRRDLRQKIDRLWKDLNKRITSPTEKRNIPVRVMQQAIEVMEAINMDTTREGSENGQKLRDKLLSLKQRYEDLKNDQDYRQAAMYDERVAEFVANMVNTVGDTPINKMSAAQLQAVYSTLQALDHVARHALKTKLDGEERDAYDISKSMTAETRSVGKQKSGVLQSWINTQLSPERMFNRLGGYRKNSTWSQVYRMLDEAQLKQTRLQVEGSLIFEDLLESKSYEKFVDPKQTVDIGLNDENGNSVTITHGMLVSLYMHLQNEQNRQHVAWGGLTIPGLKDYYNGKTVKGKENAIRIGGELAEVADINDRLRETEDADEIAELEARRDEAQIRAMEYLERLQQAIDEKLTDYDREWIAACRELFDGFSKRVLNETTMEVYGIKRANVENYFPIWVDGNFLNTPFESVAKDMSLENAGFMKERVDSRKPIRLADVSDVAASQIRKVAQYAGLMPAVRSFNKIWGKTQTGYRDSLQQAVVQTYGDSGVKYIENLMADLNGARGGEESALGQMLNRMRGRMAQASLTLSLRTALGQTASYPTAAAVLGWKALGKALAHGGKDGRLISRADQEQIRKWSPLLYYRMKGYSNTELGDIAGMNDKFSRLWKKARWLTGWIQAMDGATVGRLWYAAEYWVQDNNKALVKGTDAYYEAVAAKFNEVIELTQPNYTTMQRPDILRNPNALVKQLTMFLTQRLQNFNIVYDAAATYAAMRADLRAGKNGVTESDVKQAKAGFTTACVSQVAAAATISAFKFLADVILHSMNNYRDDDKELTGESISLELLDMFIDSLASNVLGGSEVYDVIESKVFGKTYYGIEVSGVSTVADLIDTANKVFDHVAKGEASWKDLDLLAKRLGPVAGIPYSNAMKILNAGRYWVEDAVNGELFRFEAGVDRTTAQQAHRLLRAYQEMDYGKVNKIRGEFPEDKQTELDEAVRAYIKKQYKAGAFTVYDAMRQMQKFGNASKQVMQNFIKEEYKAGRMQKNDAIKYLVEYGGRDRDSAEKTVRELTAEVETGTKFSDIEEQFLLGDLNAAQARDMLVKYGGLDRDTAQMKVDFWSYQNKHPGSGMEFSSYKTYVNKYKSIGLSVEQYEEYSERLRGCKGTDLDGDGKTDSGSKKAEVVALIDSLNLTPEQKDELYFANNYGASGLKDTPWHK